MNIHLPRRSLLHRFLLLERLETRLPFAIGEGIVCEDVRDSSGLEGSVTQREELHLPDLVDHHDDRFDVAHSRIPFFDRSIALGESSPKRGLRGDPDRPPHMEPEGEGEGEGEFIPSNPTTPVRPPIMDVDTRPPAGPGRGTSGGSEEVGKVLPVDSGNRAGVVVNPPAFSAPLSQLPVDRLGQSSLLVSSPNPSARSTLGLHSNLSITIENDRVENDRVAREIQSWGQEFHSIQDPVSGGRLANGLVTANKTFSLTSPMKSKSPIDSQSLAIDRNELSGPTLGIDAVKKREESNEGSKRSVIESTQGIPMGSGNDSSRDNGASKRNRDGRKSFPQVAMHEGGEIRFQRNERTRSQPIGKARSLVESTASGSIYRSFEIAHAELPRTASDWFLSSDEERDNQIADEILESLTLEDFAESDDESGFSESLVPFGLILAGLAIAIAHRRDREPSELGDSSRF